MGSRVARCGSGWTRLDTVAAPRASLRNTAAVTAEQSFIDAHQAGLAPYGHTLAPSGVPGSSAAEIGAVTALEFKKGGVVQAVAEPTRRGGGAAGVVHRIKR